MCIRDRYNVGDNPTESKNVIAENGTIADDLFKEYGAFPRGKPVDDPMWQTFMDMDKFGGEENREPYGGLEGVNAGPLHPIYYMVPLFLLSIIGLIWWWRNRRKLKKNGK